jgi:alpha-glucosidase
MTEDFLWWRDGIIYQIYPRSFADSNGDGIGDLSGITNKIDYLADLGIDAIWLSPIFPSPDIDFGYDVSDYQDIDSKYGSMSDFVSLLEAAHSRNIRIVLDLVLNHTSDQHPWFQQSRQSKDNPYRDWYLWHDGKFNRNVPNNWQSRFGGSGWTLDEATNQYFFHMFSKEQPDLNWRNPDVHQAILNMVDFWLKKGVDGFRLDVFNAYFKDPQYKSNPNKPGLAGFDRQKHIYDIDQPEMMPLLAEFRKLLNSYPERYAIGETFMATAARAASYSNDNALHATFDFSFLEQRYKPKGFYQSIQQWENLLADRSWPNYVLNNHDVSRSATRYVRGEKDDRLKVLAAMLLTLRGTPFLYYGEEIGMRDIPIHKKSDIQDPVGKHYWPFYKGRDGCRSPMQWNNRQYGGFSEHLPWLPLHENYVTRNVQNQELLPDSLLNFYKKLIRIRKQNPALQSGMYLPLTYDPRRLLAYIRQTSDQVVIVALNFNRRKAGLVLSSSLLRNDWNLLISTHRDQLPVVENRIIKLEGYEVLILSCQTR